MSFALTAVALLAFAGPAPRSHVDTTLQGASLAVRHANGVDHRALVRIDGLLVDPALENAARSGLPLRVRVRVELWKDGWIDHLVASQGWTSVLLFEPLASEFIVRTEPADSVRRYLTYAAAAARLEGEHALTIRPREAGRYYYTAVLELETLSLSDLEELERWLQGELQPAVSGGRSIPGALGQGAKRLMIRLLRLPTRRLEARSDRFEVS